MKKTPLHLFEGYGVELEYMIVHRDTLDVLPVCDKVIAAVAGENASEVAPGDIAWSNELVLHVIELKTNGPAKMLEELPEKFQDSIRKINALLEPLDGCLMPTGMHPWMDPHRETRLWPHEYTEVYKAYDRIFGCQGHGWSNLQSAHLNLPFGSDAEFGRLHAAIRLVLPILPALAASSPVVENRFAGYLDFRMETYRHNQRKIPQIAGEIIPEPVFTRADYEREILQKSYRAIQPYDPMNILQHEWLNSRGAIARFDRSTIEIRVLDLQECPQADLAILAATVAVIKALAAERWCSLNVQQSWGAAPLAQIFLDCVKSAESALIDHPDYLAIFDFPGKRATAGELWSHLIETRLPGNDTLHPWRETLHFILQKGTLASRILRATGKKFTPNQLKETYRQLCVCVHEGQLFTIE